MLYQSLVGIGVSGYKGKDNRGLPFLEKILEELVDFAIDSYLEGIADYKAKVQGLFPKLDLGQLYDEDKALATKEGAMSVEVEDMLLAKASGVPKTTPSLQPCHIGQIQHPSKGDNRPSSFKPLGFLFSLLFFFYIWLA